jgi:23S rRNA (pseudouridine1915-N3)-methyltransferase
MQMQIIQVGKTKQSFFRDGEQEYLKRLQPYTDIKFIQLKELGIDSNSAALREKAQQEEGKAILDKLDNPGFLIVLDELGQQFASPQFAQKIGHIKDFEGGKITFVIGGPFGLSEEVRKRANLILSFSKFTFTHEQIRLLLLEQIYRAFTILANKTYHY